jgi:hypothetical protein
MAGIKVDGIPGHEFSHHGTQRIIERAQEKMKMIAHQHPGIALGLSLFES